MRKILAIGGASVALLVALAVPALASSDCCGGYDNDVVDTDIANVDRSFNVTKSLNDHNLNLGGVLID
jgi:hypothetical protein